MRDYAAARPKAVVRIRDTPLEALVERVASGDIDLATTPNRPTAARVEALPAFDSPWVLRCGQTHALTRRKRVSWADLRGIPLATAGRDDEMSVAQVRSNAPAYAHRAGRRRRLHHDGARDRRARSRGNARPRYVGVPGPRAHDAACR
jgi:DNA-binding transcriptional LysR family regulator